MSREEVSLERKTCVIPERWGRPGGEALAAALLHSWARDASQLEEWIQRQEGSTENRKFAYLFLRLDFFFFLREEGKVMSNISRYRMRCIRTGRCWQFVVVLYVFRFSLVWRITREEVGTVVGYTMGRVSMSCSILNDDQKQTLSTRLTEEQRF